jgi:hypothetical protein
MMRELVICGWNVGFDKVLLTKTLRAEFGYSLTEGKSITDRVVENEEIRIALENKFINKEDLLNKLREIGVRASIEG